eukprot:CAMPEP_0201592844 /NCGR_PEP_ID=MMETSP0190_2-20130828/190620_1 /ASSEMBLY_ACC=CAM_ASM_000263 /TAXON_ID=37353 /ORGANISM="Rosalina sp." /LENGTH=257 /DNA_ID=CAMNT_0048051785 /DNA_START=863 /DNA_END=1633 /DNA_ORIENTATION=-
MYCYIINSYDIGARLNKQEYDDLDSKFGLKVKQELKKDDDADDDNKEKDISSLIKEKTISSYVGSKYYMDYAKLLAEKRENWFKSNTNDIKHKKFNKFYLSFSVKDLETRIDPKELKTKLAKERRARLLEKKRKEKEEADRKKKEQEEKEQQEQEANEADKQKETEKEKDKEKEKEKASETENDNDKDKDKDKDKETEPKQEEAKKEEPKKEEESSISGLDENVKNKSKASPTVLPPKKNEIIDKKEFSYGVRFNYW